VALPYDIFPRFLLSPSLMRRACGGSDSVKSRFKIRCVGRHTFESLGTWKSRVWGRCLPEAACEATITQRSHELTSLRKSILPQHRKLCLWLCPSRWYRLHAARDGLPYGARGRGPGMGIAVTVGLLVVDKMSCNSLRSFRSRGRSPTAS
jgi:hypothetical protein